MDNIFAFKDPRLRHLNKNFKREELQLKNLDFVHDKEEFKNAIDEIIKLNCNTNEFNYIHELFTKMSDLVLSKTGNWASLFTMYDKNKDNLLDKLELKDLIKDCGFTDVTDAEVGFCFNVISFFSKHINKKVFLDWVSSMIGRPRKKLIYYSQYLDIHTMRMRTQEDMKQKMEKESQFYHALRGVDDNNIE